MKNKFLTALLFSTAISTAAFSMDSTTEFIKVYQSANVTFEEKDPKKPSKTIKVSREMYFAEQINQELARADQVRLAYTVAESKLVSQTAELNEIAAMFGYDSSVPLKDFLTTYLSTHTNVVAAPAPSDIDKYADSILKRDGSTTAADLQVLVEAKDSEINRLGLRAAILDKVETGLSADDAGVETALRALQDDSARFENAVRNAIAERDLATAEVTRLQQEEARLKLEIAKLNSDIDDKIIALEAPLLEAITAVKTHGGASAVESAAKDSEIASLKIARDQLVLELATVTKERDAEKVKLADETAKLQKAEEHLAAALLASTLMPALSVIDPSVSATPSGSDTKRYLGRSTVEIGSDGKFEIDGETYDAANLRESQKGVVYDMITLDVIDTTKGTRTAYTPREFGSTVKWTLDERTETLSNGTDTFTKGNHELLNDTQFKAGGKKYVIETGELVGPSAKDVAAAKAKELTAFRVAQHALALSALEGDKVVAEQAIANHKRDVIDAAQAEVERLALLDTNFDVTTIGELEALAAKATDFAGKKAFKAKAKELALDTDIAQSIRDLLTNAAITAQGITDAKDIDPDVYNESSFSDEFKSLLTTHANALAAHQSNKSAATSTLETAMNQLTNTLTPALKNITTAISSLGAAEDYAAADASFSFDQSKVVASEDADEPTMSLADAREAAFNALIGKATIRNGNLDAAVSAATSDAEKIAIYRKMAGLTA